MAVAFRLSWYAVLAAACVIALVSARPFAGGWNDASRLATVESLVDRHTLVIDDSIFLRGTSDKLLIDGHWYSDKAPVPALLLALAYQLLQWTTGLTAAAHPRAFCYFMTVLSSGAAYVVAVAGMLHVTTLARLSPKLRLLMTASFACGTLAFVYVRFTNNHMMLLGVVVALLACQVGLAQRLSASRSDCPPWLLGLIGGLAGLAYTIDLGVGPPLLVGSLVLAGWRTRSWRCVGVATLAALPWLILHHAVNYAVGGTFQPANAVAAYLAWPGNPFEGSVTGQWRHPNLTHCVSYAVQLLAGKKGFLGHNLPLLLVFPAAVHLLRRRTRFAPELWYCLGVSGCVWLVYAVGSTNYAGACVSIRWFVPLVGLGYFVVAVWLREVPDRAVDFTILTLGGIALMVSAWPAGPWRLGVLPAHWPILGATLLTWAGWRWHVRRTQSNIAVLDCSRASLGYID